MSHGNGGSAKTGKRVQTRDSRAIAGFGRCQRSSGEEEALLLAVPLDEIKGWEVRWPKAEKAAAPRMKLKRRKKMLRQRPSDFARSTAGSNQTLAEATIGIRGYSYE